METLGSIQKKFMAACLKFCQDSSSESHQEFCFPLPFLARFPARSCRDLLLGEIRGRIPARFWPSGLLLPGENLGETCGTFPAQISPAGSHQDPGHYFTRVDILETEIFSLFLKISILMFHIQFLLAFSLSTENTIQ